MSKYPCEAKAYRMDWTDGDFYIGSTKNPYLSTRMAYHRGQCKMGKSSKFYNKMRQFGLRSFQYVMLGSIIVNNYEEQRRFEQEFINDLNPTLNSYRAWLSPEELKEYWKKWRKENHEYMKNWRKENPRNEYMKNWNKKNPRNRSEYMKKQRAKNKNKNTWLCEVCDRYYYSQSNLGTHKKTKKHLALMKK